MSKRAIIYVVCPPVAIAAGGWSLWRGLRNGYQDLKIEFDLEAYIQSREDYYD